MELKLASMRDIDSLYSIIVECRKWLKDKEIDQWQRPYPFHRFEKEVARGEVYYLETNGEKIATFTLSKSKPDYYPKDLWNNEKTKAVYLCHFADRSIDRRKYKGFGYMGNNA